MTEVHSSSPRFANRQHAGRELARKLMHYSHRQGVIVLALPRGGVPVGAEVADQLGAPLDVFVVRKIGMPGHREYAVGAIASGGVEHLDRDRLRRHGVRDADIDAVVMEERRELERREREYRDGHAPPSLHGQTVILVDDGLATGSTMRAAVEAVRTLGPARVVVAAPVGAPATCQEFRQIADDVVCARTPEPFSAVGLWYDDFSQTSDAEVHALLSSHRKAPAGAGGRL
jgi:putative phosphoribosyl transferase